MINNNMFRKFFLFTVLVFLCFTESFADFNKAQIPDSAEIRRGIIQSWITADLNVLRGKNPELYENDIGIIFQVRMEEGLENASVIVAPQSFMDVDFVKEGKTETVKMAVYPSGSPGSWVLTREKSSGKPLKIQWYFNANSEIYIQFRPEGNRTYADLVVFGNFAARSVLVGVPFNRIYTSSFEDIQNWTLSTIPWKKVNVVPGQYHEILQMIYVIREKLPFIDYGEDLCYNENGVLYSIQKNEPFKNANEKSERLTLSGTGFLKWIVDGIVEPYTGKGTVISDLTVPTVQYDYLSKKGVLSQKINLSFTLDWTRNLAAKALSCRAGRDFTFENGGVDVNINPFYGRIVFKDGTEKIDTVIPYVKDTGYKIENLKGLLYVLTATEPGWFYLCAIKEEQKIQIENISSKDNVFANSAVFFPYFDDSGKFACSVFEMDREISLDEFIERYEKSFVHLERVKASDYFMPR